MEKAAFSLFISKVYKLAEVVFFLLLGLYLIFMARNATKYTFTFTEGTENFLLTSLRITVIVKLILFFWNKCGMINSDKVFLIKVIAFFLCAIALRMVYYMVYRSDKYSFLLFLAVLVVGSIGTDYRKIMKVHTIAVGLFMGSAVLASLSGYIVNIIQLRNGQIHSSWGVINTSDFGSVVLFLCIIAWIAWREVSPGLFLFFGSVCLLNSIFIAKSITSTITSALLLSSMIIDDITVKKGKKFVSIVLQSMFPFFALLTFGIEYLYHEGSSIGVKLDQFFHGRFKYIDRGVINYKISLFGKPFSQIGHGGSTFYRANYNFIDSTYVLILLRYGIILFISIMIFWVLMTRKAIKMGHWRLAFGMGLVALHSFSEHHFPEIHYNILIILPFSVLGMGWLVDDKEPETKPHAKRRFVAGGTTAGIVVLGTLIIGPRILSIFRTIIDMTKDGRLKDKEMPVSAAFMMLIALAAITIVAFYKLLFALIGVIRDNGISEKVRIIVPSVVVVLMAMIFIGGIVVGSRFIDRNSSEYMGGVDVEKTAIEAVKRGIKTSGGCFYVDELPQIYKKEYGGVTESFFQGNELAERTNVTVLMDADYESAPMFQMGFLYTEISEEHALYTNDAKVIHELEEANYHLTGYFSRKRIVDMEAQAELNELDLSPSGSVIVSGSDKPIWRGPFFDLRSGAYTIIYDLTLSEVNDFDNDYKVCTLRVTARYGSDVLIDVPVYRKDFDEGGNYASVIKISIADCEACEFKLYTESGQKVLLNAVSCQKTPDVDIHRSYDKKGRIIRAAYYDLEGNEIVVSNGYHAEEYEYDKNGNVSQYWYSDEEGNLVITKSGYAGIGRKYDIRKRIIRDTYFDQNRERLALENGQSAVAYEYDENGNINEYKYYDVDDNLVMTANGYAILRRSFDEDKKIVYEAYFDTEDKPVTIAGGFAAVRYSYNEDGKEYDRKFYDEEGNLVVTNAGFAERHLIYDAKGNLLIEEYFGAEGERIAFSTGQSIVEYGYDMYGNKADIYYYGVDEEPVLYNGTYHHLCRVYNNKGQFIRESLFDTDDKPIVRIEGYVINEREYDEYGNNTVNRFLNADGKPVMRTDGFSEYIYTFDEKKQVTKVEYFDDSGARVLLPDGYSIVEYRFDENGNQTDVLFFDTTGTPAMNWGAYYSVHRTFNDLNQNIREDYLDANGKSMMRGDNFAAIERQYDVTGNMIEQIYLDLSDNLSLNTNGYAVICREYDETNHITKEYYLDTNRQLVDCTDGYATIEYTYDDSGNLVSTVYYNAKGEVVE